MDTGRDPREGIFPSSELIVSWLLAVTNSTTIHVFISTASRDFIVVSSCSTVIMRTMDIINIRMPIGPEQMGALTSNVNHY